MLNYQNDLCLQGMQVHYLLTVISIYWQIFIQI